MAETIVIIPTYNEKDNILKLIETILALSLSLDILIIDDNSPDGTGEIADMLSNKYKNVKVIHRMGKYGLGTAYIKGFRYALDQQYKYIMTMDADFSHHPKYIPEFIKLRDSFNIIIGSRYVKNGGTENWSAKRKLISFAANSLARLMMGLKNRDCTAGFRLYNAKVIQNNHILENFHSNGYSFLLEILFRCSQKGYVAAEIPIIFNDRRVGISKISRIEIIKAIQTLLKFFLIRVFKKNA